MISLQFRINGEARAESVPENVTLVDFVRERMGLRGTKVACDRGVCGACTVLVDGLPATACNLLAFQIDGAEVETIEHFGTGDGLSLLQRAFLEEGAVQCGYCTPGMLMLASALLRVNPDPSKDEVRQWISANVCRCTGYEQIINAIVRAAREGQAGSVAG